MMRRRLTRLRWQLTLSHLIAIAVTLVSMIAAAVLIGTVVFTLHSGPASEPVDDARLVAQAIEGLVAPGSASGLNTTLHALANGSLRLQTANWLYGPQAAHGTGAAPSLRHIDYIVVIGPDGALLGSSDPAGAAFAPPEREDWQGIAAAAEAGVRSSGRLQLLRRTSQPAALGAYPVVDAAGEPRAAVVVALTALTPASSVPTFLSALAIFGAATVAVLAAASVFALLSSAFVAYLLSRRLVARLERLGHAAQSLAAGDLLARIDEGRADEVGQLARQFNHMAADLEQTLRDLAAERDRVAGLLENRRQLIVGVSHELRTPIATVRGYLESTLRDGEQLSPAVQADLGTMAREIERLQRLIDDLFTLSRAEVGRLELRLTPTDAGAIVRRVAGMIAPLAWQQRRVQVLTEVAPNLPAALAAPDRVEQIVSNLLSNAVRHTPPGGLVAAVVCAEPNAVRFEIRDTGAGITPEDLPHVFERFYRGRGGEELGGAGLGLALVKDLAEVMGGSMDVASTVGEGSCFAVRLRCA